MPGKNYVVDVSEIAQHPEAIPAYRDVAYTALHLVGGLASINDPNALPSFDQNSNGKGPQNLIVEVESDIGRIPGCFGGCDRRFRAYW